MAADLYNEEGDRKLDENGQTDSGQRVRNPLRSGRLDQSRIGSR